MESNPNQAQCELAYQVNYNPAFRISLFWSFFISSLAIPGLVYFFVKKLIQIKFHGNLKWLLILYYASVLAFSIAACFGFGYRFFAPFFATTACELLIDPKFFMYYHVTTLFIMTSSMLIPIGFSIERFVALKWAESYEHIRTFLGPILLVTLIGSDFLVVKLIYQNETFAGPHISVILVPSTSATQFNKFFYFLLGVQIFNLICNLLLLKLHRRLKLKYRQKINSLSLRYEMEEIDQSSKFTLIVSFTHLLFAGSYVIFGLLARIFGPTVFADQVAYTVARASCCSIPTYSFVIVFVSFWALDHLNFKRANKVASTVNIKTTGKEGADNYHNVINKSWS